MKKSDKRLIQEIGLTKLRRIALIFEKSLRFPSTKSATPSKGMKSIVLVQALKIG